MKNYKLQITVTKDVLKRSMMCQTPQTTGNAGYNCAIALAVRDVLPDAFVGGRYIKPFPDMCQYIWLSKNVEDYIEAFDKLVITPKKRLDLPEITFEVEIPDEVIDKIDISKIYEGHPTLQLFESIDN